MERTLFFGKTSNHFSEMSGYSGGGRVPPSEYPNISKECLDILGGSPREWDVAPNIYYDFWPHPPEYPDISWKCLDILRGGVHTPRISKHFREVSGCFAKKKCKLFWGQRQGPTRARDGPNLGQRRAQPGPGTGLSLSQGQGSTWTRPGAEPGPGPG